MKTLIVQMPPKMIEECDELVKPRNELICIAECDLLLNYKEFDFLLLKLPHSNRRRYGTSILDRNVLELLIVRKGETKK